MAESERGDAAPTHGRPAGRLRGARPVGDLVSRLLDPVLVRKTGMTTSLIAAWPELCGTRLEASTRPEKLIWPPRRHDDVFEPATLVVAAEGSVVLRLQHQTSELIQRVNAFFGYHAVARLKIVQRQVEHPRPDRKPKMRALKPSETATVADITSRIDDPNLRAALVAYAASILGRVDMTTP